MNYIDKSIQIAHQLFPEAYKNRNGYRTYHFAFVWYKRKKLLVIGQNNPLKPNSKALKFAQRFNISPQKKHPYLHAEIDAISRLWGRFYIDSDITIVCLRLNKHGKLKNSKPCNGCLTVLRSLDCQIVYSDKKGQIRYD